MPDTALAKAKTYQRVFGGIDGQEVLADLIEQALLERSTVAATGPIDPYRTHWAEGRRSVLVYIRQQLKRAAENEPTQAQALTGPREEVTA
jgi:hypothetical protein